VNYNLAKKIHLHNAAIGPNDEDTKLYQNYGHSGGATLLPTRGFFSGVTKGVKMFNEIYLNELHPKNNGTLLVKIDVEGFELEVFRALLRTEFFPDISQFIIEFDVNYGTIDELTNLLELYSFREIRRSNQGDHYDAYWLKS
jgi:FkbM family methyltransferase